MVHDYAYHEPTLVMATKGTMESEKFNLLFQKYDNNKTYLLPCVGLGELIENGNEEEVIKYLKTNIGRYKDKVKNVVLGCTHYPLIQNEIKNILGEVQFFNGAPNLAKHLKDILEENSLLGNGKGKIEFEDSQNLEIKKKRFFEILKEET